MKLSNPETLHVVKSVPDWIKLYEQGKSTTYIAQQFNVHSSTVIRRLRQQGVVIRSKSETKMADKNPMWKNSITNSALHQWVKNNLPKPAVCQDCKERPALDLANISHTYNPNTYTRDLNNWEWLCRKCHMTKDGRLSRMYHGGRPKIKL